MGKGLRLSSGNRLELAAPPFCDGRVSRDGKCRTCAIAPRSHARPFAGCRPGQHFRNFRWECASFPARRPLAGLERCHGARSVGQAGTRPAYSQAKRGSLTVSLQIDAERERLNNQRQRLENWRLWGPYLSERAWGTVREDYSAAGTAWEYFDHDQSRSRVYRWNEDGLGGISDESQWLCFGLALWNGVDAILKERAFGLTGNQGNSGEDVKECYFY